MSILLAQLSNLFGARGKKKRNIHFAQEKNPISHRKEAMQIEK